jgi:hypothetical protein
MSNTLFLPWLIGGWAAAVALSVAGSVAMGANLSTTALLLAFGVAPAVVTVLLACSTPSRSVAEILHSVDTKESRP